MSVYDNAKLSKQIKDLERDNGSLINQAKCVSEEFNVLKEKASRDQKLCGDVAKYKEQLSKGKRRSKAYKGNAIKAH